MKTKKLLFIGGGALILLSAVFYLIWRFNFFGLGRGIFERNLLEQRIIKNRFPAPEGITPNFIEAGFLSVFSEMGGVDFYYQDHLGEEHWKRLIFEEYSFCRLDEIDYCRDIPIPHGKRVQLVGLEETPGEVIIIEIQKID